MDGASRLVFKRGLAALDSNQPFTYVELSPIRASRSSNLVGADDHQHQRPADGRTIHGIGKITFVSCADLHNGRAGAAVMWLGLAKSCTIWRGAQIIVDGLLQCT